MRALVVALMIFGLTGCVSIETANLTPGVGQQALVRDGVPAIISKKPGSVVIIRPASRQFEAGRRPVYVVAIFNPAKLPLQFQASGVTVEQITAEGKEHQLKVFSYEQLVDEEKTRQVFTAIAVGLAAGANTVNAANAGRYNANGTVYGPNGTTRFTVQGYDPVAANIAQSQANAANNNMIDNAVQQGQANLAALENTILKDNTILTGEWYGGRIVFEAPTGQSDKRYRLTVMAGTEQHEFDISQVKLAK